jgi:hypothetical protein
MVIDVGKGWKAHRIGDHDPYLRPKRISGTRESAGDETRTRDIDLGKVALYQLSYSRSASRILASPFRSSWHIGQMTEISSAIREAVRLIWAASKTSIA